MVETLPSSAGHAGLIPGQGAKIPHASGPKSQNIRQKQYCNKCNKMVHIKRILKKKKVTNAPSSISRDSDSFDLKNSPDSGVL